MSNSDEQITRSLDEGYDLATEWLKSAKDFFNDEMKLPSMLMAIAHVEDFIMTLVEDISSEEVAIAVAECLQIIKDAKEAK